MTQKSTGPLATPRRLTRPTIVETLVRLSAGVSSLAVLKLIRTNCLLSLNVGVWHTLTFVVFYDCTCALSWLWQSNEVFILKVIYSPVVSIISCPFQNIFYVLQSVLKIAMIIKSHYALRMIIFISSTIFQFVRGKRVRVILQSTLVVRSKSFKAEKSKAEVSCLHMDIWHENLCLACRVAFMKTTSMMGPGALGEMTLCSGSRWMPGGSPSSLGSSHKAEAPSGRE